MEQIHRRNEEEQYRQAFLVIRAAKNWFLWLMLLALVVDLATFVAVRFWPVLQGSPSFQARLAAIRAPKKVHSPSAPSAAPAGEPAVAAPEQPSGPAPSGAVAPGGAAAPGGTPVPSAALSHGGSPAPAGAPTPPLSGQGPLGPAAPAAPGGVPTPPEGAPAAEATAPLPAPAALAPAPSLQPVATAAAPLAAAEPNELSETFYQVLDVALPLAKSLGLICAALLSLSLLLAVGVVLAGRMGGAGHLASALMWSILLAALFVPWDVAFPSVVVPGVLFGRSDLVQGTAAVTWGAAGVDWADQVLYFARFAGYPLLAMLIWLTVQVKYVLGCRQASLKVEEQG